MRPHGGPFERGQAKGKRLTMGDDGQIHEVAVIGGGPAGYTAAIYAARAMLKPLLLLPNRLKQPQKAVRPLPKHPQQKPDSSCNNFQCRQSQKGFRHFFLESNEHRQTI